ncbi:hypothetical protein BC937DRAFT_87817 [Endogone sp. FLAS-F59071]|nr:hypothetical protein BC937DRAFT_87817 [Endogone sp. FLAS-F59071]|eukprot:RUS19217.1 hypothetical protein BC937DRAFT_87817 [Endogone sp. FLAS-F59071]
MATFQNDEDDLARRDQRDQPKEIPDPEDPEDEWRYQPEETLDPFNPSEETVEELNRLQDEEDPDWKNQTSSRSTQQEEPPSSLSDYDFFLIALEYNEYIDDYQKYELIEEIGTKTGCFLQLSSDDNQKIEIWGGNKGHIAEAKKQLENMIVEIYETTRKARRKSKWAKPPRALTEKERKREERNRKAMEAAKLYLKKRPTDKDEPFFGKQFIGIFMIPNDKFAIERIIGSNEEMLNKIRMQSKCFIWHESPANVLKVAGDTKESVDIAATRVKNLFVTFHLRPKPNYRPKILYLLDQPSENFKIRFAQLPRGFETPSIPPEDHYFTILEKLETGTEMSVNVVQDLIDLGEGELSGRLSTKNVELPPRILTLNEGNAEKLERAMEDALEKIRLFDYVIRMKIRFGQFYAREYPKAKKDWSISMIVGKYFPHPKFTAEVAPCMAKKEANVKPFKEFLQDSCPDRFADSLRDTFAFEVIQLLEFPVPPKKPKRLSRYNTRITCSFKDDGNIEHWDTITKNGFKNDGHVGMWDCVMGRVELMSANMVNLDKDVTWNLYEFWALCRNYAWELKLDAARRVHVGIDKSPPPATNTPYSSSKPKLLSLHTKVSPHSRFCNGLRLRNNDRLLYTNSEFLHVKSIIQKTKWLYYWSERNYMIEICREKTWDKKLPQKMGIDLEFDLAQEPDNQIYKISTQAKCTYPLLNRLTSS